MPITPLFAATVPEAYLAQFRAWLRADALSVSLGLIFAFLGLVACALFLLRKRSKDPTMLWFGIFSGLYGIRMLAEAWTIQLIAGVSSSTLEYFRAFITYIIPIPGILVVYEVFPNWRRVLRWLLWAGFSFAVCGIAADVISREAERLHFWNNVLVLSFTLAFVIALFATKVAVDVAILRFGLVALCLSIVIANARGLGLDLLALSFNIEPIGFAIFVATLATVVARRAFTTEERLGTLENELQIARKIQTSILPRAIPELPGIAISAHYLPMTEVAGDFYDFLAFCPRQIGILVADVSGHGIPAALIASMVKMAIAAQAPHGDDPAQVLAGMNRMLAGQFKGQFVTAAYLFLDLAALQFRYASAGHPPLLHAHNGGTQEIGSNGLALGLAKASKYLYAEQAFTPGDRFLLYTDGILEAMNETREQFGDARLKQSFHSGASSNELLQSVRNWAGNTQDDDITLVAVETSPIAFP